MKVQGNSIGGVSKHMAKITAREVSQGAAAAAGALEGSRDRLRTLMSALRARNDAIIRERKAEQEEKERLRQEEAERKRKGDEELAEAMKARAEKYASPLEKLAMAAADLQEAQQNLIEAQTGGDSATIAAALNRLGAVEDKYANAEELAAEARDNIGRSVGGTFNAWQAASVASLDFNKQTLREQRTQTGYLRQIADATRRGGGAVFA